MMKLPAIFNIVVKMQLPVDILQQMLENIKVVYKRYLGETISDELTLSDLSIGYPLCVLQTNKINGEFTLSINITAQLHRGLSIVTFNRRSYFVKDGAYIPKDGEVIVYRGTHDECTTKCERMNKNFEQQFKGQK